MKTFNFVSEPREFVDYSAYQALKGLWLEALQIDCSLRSVASDILIDGCGHSESPLRQDLIEEHNRRSGSEMTSSEEDLLVMRFVESLPDLTIREFVDRVRSLINYTDNEICEFDNEDIADAAKCSIDFTDFIRDYTILFEGGVHNECVFDNFYATEPCFVDTMCIETQLLNEIIDKSYAVHMHYYHDVMLALGIRCKYSDYDAESGVVSTYYLTELIPQEFMK